MGFALFDRHVAAHGRGFSSCREWLQPERIGVSEWRFLELDADEGSAVGGGIEYVGLRFYENKPEAKKTIAAETRCLEHLVKLMKAKKSQTQGSCRTMALADFKGLSGRGFDRIWLEARDKPTTHPTWLKRGPIDNS